MSGVDESISRVRGPLKGLRVIELGSTVAGPFCTRLMADFGADVIKVEQPEGDAVRSMGTRKDGRSLYGASIFRNKRLVSINLRKKEGSDLVRQLCLKADIIVENFRPGTMEKWGLGYDDLAQDNPGLIMVRISGFGQSGPYSRRGGYGVVGEAVSGLREITGDPERPPPRANTSLTDYIAGLYGAYGAVMAVLERARTGLGQVVDTTLYEASFSFMEPHIPAFQQLGIVAKRAGPRLPGNTPNSIYPTAGGHFIVIAAASDSVFRRLVRAIGKPELIDDRRFASGVARAENEDACDAAIADWSRGNSVDEIERVLELAGVPAARIYTVEDIFADQHFHQRDMLVDLPDEELGTVTLTGIVPKLSATPGNIWRVGQRLGQDTLAVLHSELDLSEVELRDLERAGIISTGTGRCETPPKRQSARAKE